MRDISAGVAEVNITPPVGISLCGFGGRSGPAERVHDDLFARALVLEDGQTRLALVTSDLISFAPDLVGRIRTLVQEQTGIPYACLLLNGSHSHSGPTVMAFRSMGDRDPAYEDILCRKVVGAVKMACNSRAAASLHVGRAPVRIGYNRRERRDGRMVLGHNPDGPEAPWVDVLRADREDGTPLGLFHATAAHPVNLHHLAVSAEFPGYAAEFLADQYDAVCPMFAQACCGDINCEPKDNTFEMSRHLGRLLGASALTAGLQAEPLAGQGLSAVSRTIQLPLQLPSEEDARAALEEARARRSTAAKDPAIGAYALRHRFDGQVAWAEDYVASSQGSPQAQDFEIQAIRLGELVVVAYPGEMFVDYQLTVDRESPFPRTMALGYSNGCIGYVPTADAFPEGGYEIEQAYRYYGTLMIGPESEGLIKAATMDLLETLKRGA